MHTNLWAYVFWSPLSKLLEVKVKQRIGVSNSSIKSTIEKESDSLYLVMRGLRFSSACTPSWAQSPPTALTLHHVTEWRVHCPKQGGGKSGEKCFLPESVSTLVFVGCTRWLSALHGKQGPKEQNRVLQKFFGGRMIHRIIKIGRIIWTSKRSGNAISAHA